MHPKPPKTNSQSTTLIDPSHKISKTLNTPKIIFTFKMDVISSGLAKPKI
jgi:hypothetical protein